MRNEPQLITYVDRLAGDLAGLRDLLDGELAGAFGGVHLLPFFDPIDGADAGFDPIDHAAVDARLGSWDGVAAIAAERDVMADLIVNHISAGSDRFRDWARLGDDSDYGGMFLTYEGVYPQGATEVELMHIYRPRPGLPFSYRTIAGRPRLVWTTFTPEQIDIDVDHPRTWEYLTSILDGFAAAGVRLVRLDAVGYAIKRPGTSSFMIPETFAFIDRLRAACAERDMRALVEIHSHHRHQIDVAARVDLVYDFALPPLLLDALHRADARPLRRWLESRPRNAVTVLDTHDGIGVIDVAPEGDQPGLLSADEVSALVERIHTESGGASREATGATASNLDLYQVNCTYFDALGADEAAYAIARLVQVLLPGVPQVYYAGLLAARNDVDLLAATGVGRDINRPRYTGAELADALAQPIVQKLLRLCRWRSEQCRLFDGTFTVHDAPPHELRLEWRRDEHRLDTSIDLEAMTFTLALSSPDASWIVDDIADLPLGPDRVGHP